MKDAARSRAGADSSPVAARPEALSRMLLLGYARLLAPRVLRGLAATVLSRPFDALRALRMAHDSVLVRASSYFDAGWYLRVYPDVASQHADPVIHYLRLGADEGRDPGPRFSSRAYLSGNPDVALLGTNPLVHYLRHGQAEGRNVVASTLTSASEPSTSPVRDTVSSRYPDLKPLAVVNVPAGRRVTMITDTISGGRVFGGVATGIILSALFAQRTGADLRIVTRHHRPDRGNLRSVLEFHGVKWDHKVEFVFCDLHDPYARLDVSDSDVFITTSWWTTHSAAQTLPSERIIYLVQEDERFFYPVGDQSIRAGEALRVPDVRYVVNSELLHDHLVAEGFTDLSHRGKWFEPAFPPDQYYLTERPPERCNFVFYARPNHPRNLYYRGIEVIESAIHHGILDPAVWSITFIGSDLHPVRLVHGIQPQLLETLPLSEYAALMRATDLGLSLMLTPHPSYPPLDLAASGAVAVTNRYGRKTTLARYSDNIICADADVDSLVSALAQGASLALDGERRRANWESRRLSRSWQTSMEPVVEWLADAP